MNTNILREINDAMGDARPIENIASLTITELWHTTKNPFWMRAWIELNATQYESVEQFSQDLVEIFDL